MTAETTRPFVADPTYPHWPQVATLIRDSFAYMTPLLGHVPRAADLTAQDLANAAATGTAFVIENRGTPVACLFGRPSRDIAHALYCGWLATSETQRGRGLARRLLAAAETRAITQGLSVLTLDTGTALTDLHTAFARLGFRLATTTDDVVTFLKPLPRRMTPDEDFTPLHALLTAAFAYMETRIDPPSSLARMSADSLRGEATTKEIWAIEDAGQPVACMILTPQPDTLYLGKLATSAAHRGQGLARRLIAHAESRARALNLPSVTLQTRIELSENHATFRALGFAQTGETAHPGYDRPTSLTFTKTL